MDNILTHATLASHATKLAQLESARLLSRSLAHDLNNLTTPVATYLLHTQGREPPGSPEAEVHAAALNAVKVINDYIRESLFFSRELTPEFQSVRPRELLEGLTKVTHARASQQRISLVTSTTVDAPFRADPVLLQRLGLNLIHNAIDVSPPNSTVRIEVREGPGQTVIFSVQDQGSGVPAHIQKRIFDPYFTTKNTGDATRGLGLGLAICRKIAELHGGTIDVQNPPDSGALFVTTLPQAGPHPPETPARPLPDRLPSGDVSTLATWPSPA
jgi:signal transduction histidine kinase